MDNSLTHLATAAVMYSNNVDQNGATVSSDAAKGSASNSVDEHSISTGTQHGKNSSSSNIAQDGNHIGQQQQPRQQQDKQLQQEPQPQQQKQPQQTEEQQPQQKPQQQLQQQPHLETQEPQQQQQQQKQHPQQQQQKQQLPQQTPFLSQPHFPNMTFPSNGLIGTKSNQQSWLQTPGQSAGNPLPPELALAISQLRQQPQLRNHSDILCIAQQTAQCLLLAGLDRSSLPDVLQRLQQRKQLSSTVVDARKPKQDQTRESSRNIVAQVKKISATRHPKIIDEPQQPRQFAPVPQSGGQSPAPSTKSTEVTTSTVLPCRARGMPKDHIFKTAHFVIPHNIQHGQELRCSYPACRDRGIKFRYCTFCRAPVAKRNFHQRHNHGTSDRGNDPKRQGRSRKNSKTSKGSASRSTERAVCSSVSTSDGMTSPVPLQVSVNLESSATNSIQSSTTVYAVAHSSSSVISTTGSDESGLINRQAKPIQSFTLERNSDEASPPWTRITDCEKSVRKLRWASLLSRRPDSTDSDAMSAWLLEVMAVSDIRKSLKAASIPSLTATSSTNDLSSYPSGSSRASSFNIFDSNLRTEYSSDGYYSDTDVDSEGDKSDNIVYPLKKPAFVSCDVSSARPVTRGSKTTRRKSRHREKRNGKLTKRYERRSVVVENNSGECTKVALKKKTRDKRSKRGVHETKKRRREETVSNDGKTNTSTALPFKQGGKNGPKRIRNTGTKKYKLASRQN